MLISNSPSYASYTSYTPVTPRYNNNDNTKQKVDRPSKEKHESDIEKLQDQIKAYDLQRASVTSKIESINLASKDSPLGAARAAFNKLKQQKSSILNERKAVFDRRDALKAKTDSLINDAKASKGAVKYTKLEDIEKRQKELAKRQQETTMTLNEEKKVRGEPRARGGGAKGPTVQNA